jgi:protein-L-isoaspartate(D-aspartate) O-methyltransferase
MGSFGTDVVIPRRPSAAAVAALLLAIAAQAAAADPYAAARFDMVRTIEVIASEAGGDATPTTLNASVLEAMRRAPRHAFVPADMRERAYDDRPLPIGYGQTISQPYIVAVMTDLLRLAPRDRALEIGTGSGYQAAVLAELGHQVYTIEIVPALAEQAAKRLSDLGYHAVHVREGDGYFGWPEAAPFDAIVVTAAVPQIPPPLLRQLKPGGRMIIPIGAAFLVQQLMLIEKLADGTIRTEALLPVAFVPLTRGQ